ncbi:hypothetical protein [Streptomyces zaomyceticus]|uniref:hypothetical protein n=1 Tax=Streptomyces zaomyceticus TaxID=68286 RepID=UPI002E22E6F9
MPAEGHHPHAAPSSRSSVGTVAVTSGPSESVRALRRLAARPHVLFGGCTGPVLASPMVAALSEQGETAAADRFTSVTQA